MAPLVSILIPVYNSEQWLAQTLESALNQTWENKEIIIVNDGSQDNSLAIAKSFESSITKVIDIENKGASTARNRALEAAQGDFIQYLDADDVLGLDKIEIQLKRLHEEPVNRVAAGSWGRFYDSVDNAEFIPEPVWSDLSPLEWLITSWNGGGMMHPAAWLIPRAVSEEAGGWDESLSSNDDGEYFTRVVLNSSGVSFCDKARCYYRSGILGTLSNAQSPERMESIYRSLESCSSQILEREDSPRTRKACATNFQRFIYAVYPNMTDLTQKAEAKVQSLGGSDLKPDGGLLFRATSKALGWKLAKRFQKLRNLVR